MLDKLIKGRKLTFPEWSYQFAGGPPGLPDSFAIVPGIAYNVAESEGGGFFGRGQRTSAVSAGKHAKKQHRTFRWLPYVKGKITCVPLVGPTILTGEFSGCWVARFRYGGTEYIAHIGTETSARNLNTRKVRKDWQTALATPGFDLIGAFNPIGSDLPADAFKPPQGWLPFFYAAITGEGDFYSASLATAAPIGKAPSLDPNRPSDAAIEVGAPEMQEPTSRNRLILGRWPMPAKKAVIFKNDDGKDEGD